MGFCLNEHKLPLKVKEGGGAQIFVKGPFTTKLLSVVVY